MTNVAAIAYDPRYLGRVALRPEQETGLALALAELMTEWGRVEYCLYLVLEAIDPARAAEWTDAFLGSASSLATKGKIVRREVERATAASFPDYRERVDETLEVLTSIRNRRNLLAHGVWRRSEAQTFAVMPLRQSAVEVTVDYRFVCQLIADIRDLINDRLGMLMGLMHIHRYAVQVGNKSP